MTNLLISTPEMMVRSDTISELLDKLTKYAAIYFRAEEQLLEEYGYPGLAIQREEHKAYRIKIVELYQATFIHKDSVPKELVMFLRDWWVKHILETDMKYRSSLTKRGVE